MRATRIIKRELVTAFSRLGLRKVSTDYMGMRLVVPVVHGMVNDGYIVPAESWMSDCLEAFITTRRGCVLDVGSSVGVYLVKLRVLSPDVEYFGVEPNPASNFYVQQLIRLNRFRNARVLPFAFSDVKGVRMIYTGSLGSKSASALEPEGHGPMPSHSFQAYFTTGDEVVASLDIEEMAVLKLDVEGLELEAMRGLERTVGRLRPYIYCEILHGGDRADSGARATSLCELVRAMDYEILGVVDRTRTLELIPRAEQPGEEYWEEYIFAPSELVPAFLEAIRGNRSGIRVPGGHGSAPSPDL